jgi:hypothetical protein
VIFRDLVDSTGIAARLDAEEWRDLVGSYIDAASAALKEMGSKGCQQARRRLDGAVRLSAGAGERQPRRQALKRKLILVAAAIQKRSNEITALENDIKKQKLDIETLVSDNFERIAAALTGNPDFKSALVKVSQNEI